MHWHRDWKKWALPSLQMVLHGRQSSSMPSVRLVVCRGTHLLSATMAHLPLSMPTPFKVSNPHHNIPPNPLLTTKVGRAIPTPHTKILTHLLKMSCDHFGSNIELPTPHHLHLNHLQRTWRAWWSSSYPYKLWLMNLLVHQSICWPPSLIPWQPTKRRWTPRLAR